MWRISSDVPCIGFSWDKESVGLIFLVLHSGLNAPLWFTIQQNSKWIASNPHNERHHTSSSICFSYSQRLNINIKISVSKKSHIYSSIICDDGFFPHCANAEGSRDVWALIHHVSTWEASDWTHIYSTATSRQQDYSRRGCSLILQKIWVNNEELLLFFLHSLFHWSGMWKGINIFWIK